jgi:hypothetical protein
MRLLRRLAYWRRLSAHQADLMDEIAHHREMIERDLIQRGMSPAAAHGGSAHDGQRHAHA